jgi:hypothetical protein
MKRSGLYISFLLFLACETDFKENRIDWGLNEDQNSIIVDSTEFTSSLRFTERQSFAEPDSLYIGEITRFAVNEQDDLIIADDANARIHVFDNEGRHIQVFGRSGSGPGEFQNITGVGVYQNELFIMDPAQQRISIFHTSEQTNPGFEYLGLVQISGEMTQAAGVFPILFHVIRSDEWLIGGTDSFRHASTSDERKVHYYRLHRNSEIDQQRAFVHRAAEHLAAGSPESPTIFSFPHLGKPLFQVTERYLISAWSKDPVLHLFDNSGEEIRSIVLPVRPQALSATDIPELIGAGLEPLVEQARESVLRDHGLSETWPALNDLLGDDENRLWVSTIVEDFEVYEWWVLKESGELITRFEWPRDEPIEVVKNGFVYTRQTDEETGLQQVVRYKIEFSESG